MDITGRQGDLRALGVFEGKVQNDHDELYELLGGILVKIEPLRWLGHIARGLLAPPARAIIERDPTGTRRREAQRVRWLD